MVLLDNDYPIDLILGNMKFRIIKLIRKLSVKKPEQKMEKKDRKMVVFSYIKNISITINSSIDKDEYIIVQNFK